MSKFLNILLPALGGAAIVLGVAFGMASRNYQSQEVDSERSKAKAAEQRTKEKTLEVTELAGRLDDLEGNLTDLRRSMANTGGPSANVTQASLPKADYGLGRVALPQEIAAWDINIHPDGAGLPKGRGDALTGEEVFADKCASCHGDFAEGVDNWPVLSGGFDTLADKDPVKTVGSYWPHLSTVWDYVHRSMPFGGAQTLSDDEVYAIVAYILYSNDLVEEEFELTSENFLDVEMYNANGFIIDDREATEYINWRIDPCMENCKASVEITMRASVLDVTPEEEESAAAKNTATDADLESVKVAAVVSEELVALIADGERVFKKCKSCHQVGENAKNKSGPHLNNLMGRSLGAVDGFKYSRAFAEASQAGRVWTIDELAAFLKKPKAYIKGTKMSFSGLKNANDIDAIIAYLASYSEQSYD
jgi:S-disulfanyl-L-cysteine oxidoreductase SoxD